MEITSKSYLFLLSSGCEGCEGNGIYATITKVIFNGNWYDDVASVIIEGGDDMRFVAADVVDEQLKVYAAYASGAPKEMSADKFTWAISAGTTGLSVDNTGKLTGTAAAGTATVTAIAKDKDGSDMPALTATANITVA